MKVLLASRLPPASGCIERTPEPKLSDPSTPASATGPVAQKALQDEICRDAGRRGVGVGGREDDVATASLSIPAPRRRRCGCRRGRPEAPLAGHGLAGASRRRPGSRSPRGGPCRSSRLACIGAVLSRRNWAGDAGERPPAAAGWLREEPWRPTGPWSGAWVFSKFRGLKGRPLRRSAAPAKPKSRSSRAQPRVPARRCWRTSMNCCSLR